MRVRELEVTGYNLKEEIKDLKDSNKEMDEKIDERDKEIRRLKDIVYSATTMDLKPQFGDGNNLKVPRYANYD